MNFAVRCKEKTGLRSDGPADIFAPRAALGMPREGTDPLSRGCENIVADALNLRYNCVCLKVNTGGKETA